LRPDEYAFKKQDGWEVIGMDWMTVAQFATSAVAQSLRETNVRFLHKADMLNALTNVRFWGQGGHCSDWSVSPLMTISAALGRHGYVGGARQWGRAAIHSGRALRRSDR
jgi:hypothetical protein